VLFDVLPYHVFRVLAALAVVLMLITFPGIDFLLLAIAFGVGEWYTRTRRMMWPSDVEQLLSRVRLAVPKSRTAAQFATPPTPVVPLRPLTTSDIFSGAFKVVFKNWPSLVGIPMAIIVAFGLVLTLIMWIVMEVFFRATMSMSGTMFMAQASAGTTIAALIAMVVVMYAIICAIALPADALLLASTVIATDKAVRGEAVRLTDIFAAAKGRMFAVLRMTLAFYGIFVLPEFLIFLLVGATIGFFIPGLAVVWLLIFSASFVLGILLSLSPVVLIVEKRGVADSLKRSMQLTKPAAGRLIGIHLLWAVCITLLFIALSLSMFAGVLGLALIAVAFPSLIAYFRALQMLIYTDLRIRREGYDRELIADWTRNTAH
jgi:hypothetical protein